MNNYEYQTLATCPGTKSVGNNIRMSVSITQGVSPYTLTYKKDGVELSLPISVPTIGTYYYDYTAIKGDIKTPVPIFSVDVVDSCSPTPQTWTDQCSVTVECPTVTLSQLKLNGNNCPSDVLYGTIKFSINTPTGGIGPYVYQWFLDGTSAGITGLPELSKPNIPLGAHTAYCIVSDGGCNNNPTTTQTCSFNVIATCPTVTLSQFKLNGDYCPSSVLSGTIIFSIDAPTGGIGPYAYQWFLDDVYAGSTGSPEISKIGISLGSHTAYCVVYDGGCSNNPTTTQTCSFDVTTSCTQPTCSFTI